MVGYGVPYVTVSHFEETLVSEKSDTSEKRTKSGEEEQKCGGILTVDKLVGYGNRHSFFFGFDQKHLLLYSTVCNHPYDEKKAHKSHILTTKSQLCQENEFLVTNANDWQTSPKQGPDSLKRLSSRLSRVVKALKAFKVKAKGRGQCVISNSPQSALQKGKAVA